MSIYRNLMWDETITLYHRSEGKDAFGKTIVSWTRTVLQKCFYGLKHRQKINGLEIVSNNSHIVRIPGAYEIEIGKGDIVVRGNVPEILPVNDSGSSLKTKYAGSCFTVNVTVDNTKLPKTAHYYAAED